MTEKQYNEIVKKLVRRGEFEENAKHIFTQRQIDKIIELVACSYMYNEDMKTGTPQEQRLLKNIYYILTGSDNPNDER